MWPRTNAKIEGDNKAMMRATGLINFRGKSIDELTEEESKDARAFIYKTTGISYYWTMK